MYWWCGINHRGYCLVGDGATTVYVWVLRAKDDVYWVDTWQRKQTPACQGPGPYVWTWSPHHMLICLHLSLSNYIFSFVYILDSISQMSASVGQFDPLLLYMTSLKCPGQSDRNCCCIFYQSCLLEGQHSQSI